MASASNALVKQGTSSTQIKLHPLPILNISEHLTRVSLQQNNPAIRVVGGLLGIQQGRDVEIMNTFEIVVEPDAEGVLKVDHAYFVTRKDQFKQVFPTFDLLGWYSVGLEPNEEDMALHKQFFEYNETPLFLQLSRESLSSTSSQSKDLPVAIYETLVEIVNGEPTVAFLKGSYEIETGEAERVAVDHASKPSTTSEGAGERSGLIASLTTQRNAIKMLFDRISIIVKYLDAVQNGSAPKDNETLRQISALVTSLPATDSKEFRGEFMTEYNDVLLTTYLATLTKQLYAANRLLDQQMLLTAGLNPSGLMGGGGRDRDRDGLGGFSGGRHRGGRRGDAFF